MIYYVYQGRTYGLAAEGNYVWSHRNPEMAVQGFERMRRLEPGDIILHSCAAQIRAISIVQEKRCRYTSNSPNDSDVPIFCKTLAEANGYFAETKYYEFDHPVVMREHVAWLAQNYIPGSAFNVKGQGLMSYLCNIAPDHAVYLLQACIEKGQNKETNAMLHAALKYAKILQQKRTN